MNKRKLVNRRIVLLAVFVLLIAVGYLYCKRGVYVSITNNTKSTLKEVDIAYEVGVIQIDALEPKMSYGRYINPTYSTGLTLKWCDSSGVKHSHDIGVYLQHNYSGSVEITVESDNSVVVTDKVRSLPWPL